MTKVNIDAYIKTLDELYFNIKKDYGCDYDCYNCDLGILKSECSGYSCSIDALRDGLNFIRDKH